MIVITNRANLPLALVAAIQNDPYDAGDCDITATRLIQPPRKVELERQHRDEITEDASERIWALMGQLGHTVLERSGVGLVEHRLCAQVLGWKIGGKADIVGETKITDWKFTSVWSAKDGAKQEWIEQLNILAYLAAVNKIKVKALEIVCIYRDWSKLEARRSQDYPQVQAEVFKLPLWDEVTAEIFISQRVRLHQAARKELPECTSEERWEKPEKWAIHKAGRERAVKLHATEEGAQIHLDYLGAGHRIEHRPGEQVRCESYCNAAPFCSQWSRVQQQNKTPKQHT